MPKKKTVTNAMRSLTAANVEFETIEYDSEILDSADNFGEEVARLTGLNADRSFKTLVARSDKGAIYVCCIPVNRECDLKKLAKVSGEKKCEMIHVKELLALTGYMRGSVSPIGMKKKFPTFIDETCLEYDKMGISGGMCGLTLLISPQDLIKTINAKTADIVKGGALL